jgi:endonuclease/exonuclease/phosphatase family metal-dependent hydrolase
MTPLPIFLGDFNCHPTSDPYHAFTGVPQGGRIDWILFDRRFDCLSASVDRRSKAGRYPSDHFPVAATLRLKPPSRMTP